MAKAPKQELVAVRLVCIYSGFDGDPGPGEVINLPADEAARLVAIGAAVAV